MQQTSRSPQNRPMIKYAVRGLLSGRVFVCFLAWLIPQVLPWLIQLIPVSFGVVNVLIADLVPLGFSVPLTLLSFAATVFVTDPMAVKLCSFFLTLNRDPDNLPSPLSVCDCFGPGYLRLVSTMLQRTLRIWAWSLLPVLLGLLLPGAWQVITVSGYEVIRIADWYYWLVLVASFLSIYRSIVYSMVPYLLADHPEMTPAEVLRRSREMTRGRIWELFVLELSFFGWLVIVSITLMVGAVYVAPYIEGTMAAYYIAFAEADGHTQPIQLDAP